MDSGAFDHLTRELAATPRGRRGLLRGAVAGVVGVLFSRTTVAAACVHPGSRCNPGDRCCDGRCQGGRCRCGGGKKPCEKRCIGNRKCCKDKDCGPQERCAGGTCEPCLGQGTTCSEDAECCTGICDTYTNRCQQVRVYCNEGESCPGGRCCSSGMSNYCLYEDKATQRACTPQGSCGYLLCGDRCSDLDNGSYEFCGYEGSAACRNGRCCCPKGIPLADCPDIQNSDPGATLPRCPD